MRAIMKCYIFDIDGTLADIEHRLHHISGETKDWRAFFADCSADKPIDHICDLAWDLGQSNQKIVYLSGRSDECRDATEAWMREHDLPKGPLYMRKAGDYRADTIVKMELLEQLKADGYEPIMAFEDRDRV